MGVLIIVGGGVAVVGGGVVGVVAVVCGAPCLLRMCRGRLHATVWAEPLPAA